MKNRKGFTLVELIVAVAILGIISLMAIPLIKNIEENNRSTKFSTYLDSLVASSKLYVDSYSEDMFTKSDGCAYVKYSDLKDKKLVKDIQVSGISCDTDNTFVRVSKRKGKYNYRAFMGCVDTNGDTRGKMSVVLPKHTGDTPYVVDEAACGGVDAESDISIKSSLGQNDPTPTKIKTMHVNLESYVGIHSESINIQYGWAHVDNINEVTNWTRLDFKNPPTEAEQDEMFADPDFDKIVIKSVDIQTPAGYTGNYFLVIKVNSLYSSSNSGFNSWTNVLRPELGSYATFGPYVVDNTPPVIGGTLVSSTSGYNNTTAKSNITFTDEHPEGVKFCHNFNNYCSATDTYGAFPSGSSVPMPSTDYNGAKYTFYLTAKDAAGNISKKSFDYTVYKMCAQYMYKDNTSSCTVKCGGGTYARYGYDKYFTSNRCTAYDTSSGGSACNTQGCCSSTYVSCGSWGSWGSCSAVCGGGTQYSYRTCGNYSNYTGQYCSAQTNTSYTTQSKSCNTQGCCSSTYVSCGNYGGWGSCSKSCGGGTQSRTRSCGNYSSYNNGWCSSQTSASYTTQSQACNTQSCAPTISCSWSGANGIYTKSSGSANYAYYYKLNGYTSGTISGGLRSGVRQTGYGSIDYKSASKWQYSRSVKIAESGKGTDGSHASNQCYLG